MERHLRPVWAVVDIGSNSLRLVVYRVEKTGFLTLLTNLKNAVRLSEYLDINGCLTPDAISILVETLIAFRSILPVWKPEKLDIVATAPLRYARNQAEIVDIIKKRVNWTVRILRGEEEAHYAFLAAVHTTYVENGIAIDMGGGSTELALYRDRTCIARASLPFGALLLAQRFANEDRLTSVDKDGIISFIAKTWQKIPWLANCSLPIVGIGGTVRALGKAYLRSCASPISDTHQGTIPEHVVLDWTNRIVSLSTRERRKDLGIPRGRTIVAAPASLTIGSLLSYAGSPALVICRGGLREGMLYDRLNKTQHKYLKKIVSPSIRSLAEATRRYAGCGLTSPLANTTALLMRKLSQAGWLTLTRKEQQYVLKAAALVPIYETDRRNTARFQQILNWSWDGFSHVDQCKLLWISSPGDNCWRAYRAWWNRTMTYGQCCQLQKMAAIVSLARAMTWTQRSILENISCTEDNKGSKIVIKWTNNAFLEKQRCLIDKRHLEKALRRSLRIEFEN